MICLVDRPGGLDRRVSDALTQINFENLKASGLGSSVNVIGSDGDNVIIGSRGNDIIDGGAGG